MQSPGLGQILDLPFTDYIYVNNRLAGKDEKVYENFSVEWSMEEKHTEVFAEEAAVTEQEPDYHSLESDSQERTTAGTVGKLEAVDTAQNGNRSGCE